MAAYYFDTSALVKRYVQEVGTPWVMALTDPTLGHDIYIVRITGPEVISALFRRARGGDVTDEYALRVAEDFKIDLTTQYQIVEVTGDVADRAMILAQEHGLRGYDSVQLAAALELHNRRSEEGPDPVTFVSADNDLNPAAEAEGLETDNPDAHS